MTPAPSISSGFAYANGRGVPEDYVTAHMWAKRCRCDRRRGCPHGPRECRRPHDARTDRRGASAGTRMGESRASVRRPFITSNVNWRVGSRSRPFMSRVWRRGGGLCISWRGERQFARRHVRHDLVVRGASDPFVAGQAYDSPTCAEPTSPSTSAPSCPQRWRFRRLLWCCCGIAVRPHGRIGERRGDVRRGRPRRILGVSVGRRSQSINALIEERCAAEDR